MTNSKTKTAIFGGSFDPPHFGHIDIVKNLEKKFDGVIVMPSYVSPFKTDGGDANARYKLCKKVFASDKTTVSRYEISKKGVSYSVDTAKYLGKKTDGKLYWVIGSEELVRLGGWRDIDTLKTLVTFYVVPRPGYAASEAVLKALKKRKIKIVFAKFDGLDISSTRIKIDRAFGLENKYTPDAVNAYAKKFGLFDPYSKYVRALYAHKLDYARVMHTYRTACRGEELAKMYGANVNDAVTACILHDIAKSEDLVSYIDKVDMHGFPDPTAHSPVGAYIAKKEFGVSDEIANAIAMHSTACADMSLVGEIVYLADKTENGRKYKSLEHKRYLCGYDKNIAMLAALKEIKSLQDSSDCKFSRDAIEYYEKLCGDREIPPLPEREHREPVKTEKLEAKKNRGEKQKKFVSSGDPVKDIALAVADELDKHKGHDIDIIDVSQKTVVADYFVIASASSTTGVKALMGYAEDRLTKQFGLDPNKRDINSEWIALDYGSVIIHIFTDKTRMFYNIERLWSDGSNTTRIGE